MVYDLEIRDGCSFFVFRVQLFVLRVSYFVLHSSGFGFRVESNQDSAEHKVNTRQQTRALGALRKHDHDL